MHSVSILRPRQANWRCMQQSLVVTISVMRERGVPGPWEGACAFWATRWHWALWNHLVPVPCVQIHFDFGGILQGALWNVIGGGFAGVHKAHALGICHYDAGGGAPEGA